MKEKRGNSKIEIVGVLVALVIISSIFFINVSNTPTGFSIFDENQAPRPTVKESIYHISKNQEYEINLNTLFKDEDDDKLYFFAESTDNLELNIIQGILRVKPTEGFTGQEKITIEVTDLKKAAKLDLTINVLEGKVKIKDYSHLVIDVKDKYARKIGNVEIKNREDAKFDAKIEHTRVRNAEVEINGGETEKASLKARFDKVTDKEVTTTVFGIEEVEIENAVIKLPKEGEVNAIGHCENFDVDLFLCLSGWQTTDIDFEDHGEYISFTVEHFTAYGGLNITNPKQTPQVGGLWTVNFTTNGTFDLNISPINGTYFVSNPANFSEWQSLEFISLKCNQDEITPQIITESENSTTIKHFYVPGYNCDDETSYFTSKEILPGEHFLNFSFNDNSMLAQNHANCGASVSSSETQTSNISTSGDCIEFTGNNIDFNCDGYSIDAGTSGIALFAEGRQNITIRNCEILGSWRGIYFNNTNVVDILDNNMTTVTDAVLLVNSSKVNIVSNIITTINESESIFVNNGSDINITENLVNITGPNGVGIRVKAYTISSDPPNNVNVSFNTVNVSDESYGMDLEVERSTISQNSININQSINMVSGVARGIEFSNGDYNNVTHNTITTEAFQGNCIDIGNTDYNNISFNSCKTYNISSRGYNMLTLSDYNILDNNNYSSTPNHIIPSSASYGFHICSSCSNNNLTNNLVYISENPGLSTGIFDLGSVSQIKNNNITVLSNQSEGIKRTVSAIGISHITGNTILTHGRTTHGIEQTFGRDSNYSDNQITTYGNTSYGLFTQVVIGPLTIINNTITTFNTSDSIALYITGSSGTIRNNNLYALDSAEYQFLAGASNTFRNVNMSNKTNVSIQAMTAIKIDVPSSNIPANPSNQSNITHYLNITNITSAGSINFSIHYTDEEVSGVNESTLKIHRYNESSMQWEAIPGSYVDEANNEVISGTITSFSIFAPLGTSSSEPEEEGEGEEILSPPDSGGGGGSRLDSDPDFELEEEDDERGGGLNYTPEEKPEIKQKEEQRPSSTFRDELVTLWRTYYLLIVLILISIIIVILVYRIMQHEDKNAYEKDLSPNDLYLEKLDREIATMRNQIDKIVPEKKGRNLVKVDKSLYKLRKGLNSESTKTQGNLKNIERKIEKLRKLMDENE